MSPTESRACLSEGMCPECKHALVPILPIYIQINGASFDRTLVAGHCLLCDIKWYLYDKGAIWAWTERAEKLCNFDNITYYETEQQNVVNE